MRPGQVVVDSAGVAFRYTRIADIEPGDVVIEGWRVAVKHRHSDGVLYYLDFEDGGRSNWLTPDTLLPVEVLPPDDDELPV